MTTVRIAEVNANAITPRRRDYSRWRAGTLIAVYVLMGLHIAHWKIAGKTLAPLELNEVLYTLELGIITAGFIFMAVVLLSTLIFGRFFCSWACHILALEDFCAWLLGKIGIRPKPVRSRVLLLVPPAALFYMFIWPHISRLLEGQEAAALKVQSDAEGWASFVTNDFWRNLPGPYITILTFLICGFVIVYFLGSRSFCKYACPYGALFALADRVAPGQLLEVGNCTQCGHCTAVCTSHVRVHDEIRDFGKIVDPNCMKDLDCVTVCPEQAIGFGFARPAMFKSWKRKGRKRHRYDFSLIEELLMAVAFLGTFYTFRYLYDLVPFLLALGVGGIFAYGAVLSLRLIHTQNVRLNNFQLKKKGRIQRGGWAFAMLAAITTAFVIHSAYVRYHEFRGLRAYERLMEASGAIGADHADLTGATHHLTLCSEWGLYRPPNLDHRLATLHLMAGADDQAQPYLERVRDRSEARAHLLVGEVRRWQQDVDGAIAAFRASVAADGENPDTRSSLAGLLTRRGRFGEAIEHYEAAIALNGSHPHVIDELAMALNEHGFRFAQRGSFAKADALFRKAITLQPGLATSHFNLGMSLVNQGRTDEAMPHLENAARLDARYAQLFNQP